MRDVVIPLSGTYQIIVADKATFAGGLPAGGDGHTYGLIVEQVPQLAPVDLPAEVTQTGLHDAIKSFRFDPATLSADLVDVSLTSSDEGTAHVLWFIDECGRYVEFDAGDPPGAPIAAFVPQAATGTIAHVDYVFHTDPGIGPTTTFSLSARPLTINEGPAAGTTDTVDTEGDTLSFFRFDLDVNHIDRFVVELPRTSSLDLDVALANQSLELLSFCRPAQNDADRLTFTCLRYVADEGSAGEHFVVLINAAAAPISDVINTQARISLDEAPVETVIVSAGDEPSLELDSVDIDDDDFGAPWYRVIYGSGLDLRADGDRFDVYDARSAELVIDEVDGLFAGDAEQTSGFAFLLRPRSDDFGVIDLSARPLPYLFEDEPENQSADDATFLPDGDDDNLPFGAAAGVIDESDVDLWAIDVAGPGTLTVQLGGGPFDVFQVIGNQADGDAQVELVDQDGVTSLTAPAFGSASACAWDNP